MAIVLTSFVYPSNEFRGAFTTQNLWMRDKAGGRQCHAPLYLSTLRKNDEVEAVAMALYCYEDRTLRGRGYCAEGGLHRKCHPFFPLITSKVIS